MKSTRATRAAVQSAVMLGIAGASLSACVLRGPVTNTFGFMPKPLRDARATPSGWGWHDAKLDTISRADSAGGLLAWWGAAPAASAQCGGALLLHGKGKNRAEMLALGQAMQAAGFSVLIPDYRGYGGTAGEPTTSGVFSDAALAYRDLRVRLGDSVTPIVVIGHSMGTALAARLTRDNSPVATVYMTPFTRISTLVRARAGAIGPRLFDTTAFAFNPIEDAAAAPGRSLVVVAGRDLLIRKSVTDAFVAGLSANGGVVRDPKASHAGVVKSKLVLQAVTDSMRAWTGCGRQTSVDRAGSGSGPVDGGK